MFEILLKWLDFSVTFLQFLRVVVLVDFKKCEIQNHFNQGEHGNRATCIHLSVDSCACEGFVEWCILGCISPDFMNVVLCVKWYLFSSVYIDNWTKPTFCAFLLISFKIDVTTYFTSKLNAAGLLDSYSYSHAVFGCVFDDRVPRATACHL